MSGCHTTSTVITASRSVLRGSVWGLSVHRDRAVKGLRRFGFGFPRLLIGQPQASVARSNGLKAPGRLPAAAQHLPILGAGVDLRAEAA